MRNSGSSNGHGRGSKIGGSGSLGKTLDGGWPSNSSEISRDMLRHEKEVQTMSNAESHISMAISPGGSARGTSPGGHIGPIYTEKVREQSPRKVLKRPSTARSPGRRPSSKDDMSTPVGNGTRGLSVAEPNFSASKKRKKGGLGTVIRRIFGRRSVKNRISLPAPVKHHEHDPHNFITSPADLKPQRAASAPSADMLRTSALGSHSPFVLNIPKDFHASNSGVPPQPERPPPGRPARPRRASLPSVILSSQEAEDINKALAGLGLQEGGDQIIDGRDIGFAVTSGSNPKRRSRSVGDYRSAAKEHRMSPIQWRQWRRRSDEIRYWRENTSDNEPMIESQPDIAVQEQRFDPVDPATHTAPEANDETRRPFEAHNQDFNFGLPMDDLRGHEHIDLEERMITLELKLMDFDFAISKLQAGSFSPPDPREPAEAFRGGPTHTRSLSDQPRVPFHKPHIEHYQSFAQRQFGDSPRSHQGSFVAASNPSTIQPRPRPASIATTLKANATGQYSSSDPRASVDRSSRNSTTQLTIEHYTTLITLIRREQSARMQLEDQVTELQRQVESLQAHSTSPRSRIEQQHLGRHFSPDDVRRPFGLGFDNRQRRGRSSNYSTDTDTDEDNFHDVYVTPVERGEFERDDFEGEEGVAF